MSKQHDTFDVSPKLFKRRKIVDKKGNTTGFMMVVKDANGEQHDVYLFPTRFQLEQAQRVLTEAFLSYTPNDL